MTICDESILMARLSATLDLLEKAAAIHQTIVATESACDESSGSKETAALCAGLADRACTMVADLARAAT